MPPRTFPTCLVCGDRIGFYEPTLALDHDGDYEAALTNEPHLANASRAVLAHAHCAGGLPEKYGSPALRGSY